LSSSLLRQVAFEFRQGPKYMKDQLLPRGSIHSLLKTAKPHLPFVQSGYRFDEVPKGPAQTVQRHTTSTSPSRRPSTPPAILAERPPPRSPHLRKCFAAIRLEGVPPKVQVLCMVRNPVVANEHRKYLG
jgi:hypothetical protein